jgi:NAD+ kinase
MSEAPGGVPVGVVGGDGSVADAVAAAGGDPVAGEAAAVVDAGPRVVVAVGEPALVDLVAAGVDVPVLPVSVADAVQSVSVPGIEPAVASVLAGEFETVTRPLLSVANGTDAELTRALFDLALVTDEPARISEFTVLSGADRVATFRADGVVVATPAGSTGYARAAEGPVLAPGTGVAAVVPISPFVTDADHWVLSADGVGLRVERDETPVRLVADGRDAGTVEPHDRLSVSTRGSLAVAVVDASAGVFDSP